MKHTIYFLFVLFSSWVFAQVNPVETKIDKNKNKIGAQFNLTLKTTVDTTSTVTFPATKTFGSLEVIRNYVVDTIKKGSQYELIKKYGLTQFEPGKFTIPSLPILINKKPIYSDTLSVQVFDVAVDTLKQKMFDIKPIAKADDSFGNWWIYLIVAIVILLIAGIGYYLWKKRKKDTVEELVFSTPIEKAIGLLKLLDKKQLWQKGEIKTYYSELTDIAREYIEEVIEIPAKEYTTSELIASLRKTATQKKLTLTKESLSNLERVLRQADLVKFAKSKPLDFEIEEDKKRIEKSIVSLHQAIPNEVNEQDELEHLNELQKIQKNKKKRKDQIIKGIAIAVGIFIISLIILTVTKGYDFVKDNIIGHPTKELLEGKWVFSEYGNPSVQIKTPKVLKRMDAMKMLPKEIAPMIKEASCFVYGSMQGSFYLGIMTALPKQEMKYDLEQGLNGTVNSFGGQNLVVQHTDFQTPNGAEGIKGFGTFSKLDPILKKSVKVYFDVLVFKEEGGFQQIVILHEEGDQYANKITERIIQSVELKKSKE